MLLSHKMPTFSHFKKYYVEAIKRRIRKQTGKSHPEIFLILILTGGKKGLI